MRPFLLGMAESAEPSQISPYQRGIVRGGGFDAPQSPSRGGFVFAQAVGGDVLDAPQSPNRRGYLQKR